MICKICGAIVPDNAPFCGECGALTADNQGVQPQTVQQSSQTPQQQYGVQQPQQVNQSQVEQSSQAQQQSPYAPPQQHIQPQPQVQQPQQSPYAPPQSQVQQPQPSPYAPPQQQVQQSPYAPQQPQVQQPQQSPYAPPQQQVQQPQPSPYAPPQQHMQPQIQQQMQQPQQHMQPQNTGAPQQAFRNQLKGIPESQNNNKNAAVDNAKKGASRGLIIGIIVFLILAAAAAVFFIFVLPKLSKGAPKGEYVNEDFGGYVLFDNGIYAVYDDQGAYEFGTYEIKNDKITFTSVNGDVDHGKYNKKDNTVEYGYVFKLNDAKQTFGVDIDKKYVKELKDKFTTASESALASEEVKTEAKEFAAAYYIYGNELVEPRTEFAKALAENLGYSSDNVLAYLIENKYITVSIMPDVAAQTVEVIIY